MRGGSPQATSRQRGLISGIGSGGRGFVLCRSFHFSKALNFLFPLPDRQ